MQISDSQKKVLTILGITTVLLITLYFTDSLITWQFGCFGHIIFLVGLFVIIKNVIRLFVFPGSFWLWRRNVENRYAKALAKRAHKRMEDLSSLIKKFLNASEQPQLLYSVKQFTAEDLMPIKKTLQSFINTFAAMNYRKELNKQQKDLFTLCQLLEQNLKDLIIIDKSLYDYLEHPHELFNLAKSQQNIDTQACSSILNLLDTLIDHLLEIYQDKNILLSMERWLFNKTLGTVDQMRVELENTFKTKRIKVQGYDFKQIDCLFIYASEEEKEDPGPTVIFCQPNAGYYEYMYYESEWIDYYMKRGVNMFLWNYRGYCESEGLPNTQDILSDGEVICDYVTQQLKVTKLIIHGESLGGMVACHLGRVKQCTVLFADRTFASISKIAEVGFSKYASFFFNLITSWDYNSAQAFVECENYKILALDCKDEVIPYLSSLKVEVGKQILLKEFGQGVNDDTFQSNEGWLKSKISKYITNPDIQQYNQIWHSQILNKQEMQTFYDANQRIQYVMRELQTERSKKTLDDSYSNYLNESQDFEKQMPSQQSSLPATENEEVNNQLMLKAIQLQGSCILSERDKTSEILLKFVSKVYECFEAFESASMTLNDVFSIFNESDQFNVFMDYLLSIFFWGSYQPLKNIPKKKMSTVVCQKLAFARFTTNINKIETLIKNEKNNLDSPVGQRLIQDLELVISRFRLIRENFKKAQRSLQQPQISIQIEQTQKSKQETKASQKMNESVKHQLGAFIPLSCGHNGNLNQTEVEVLDFHMNQAGILRF